jgi:four helix bundle protein
MHTYYFEKLEVWQNSRELVKRVYTLTDDFPQKEVFGMTSQLRRAALSISANVAEGMSRKTNKDKMKFLNIAYSSGIEVLNFLILSVDLEFMKEQNYLELRERLEKITNQLGALTRKLGE